MVNSDSSRIHFGFILVSEENHVFWYQFYRKNIHIKGRGYIGYLRSILYLVWPQSVSRIVFGTGLPSYKCNIFRSPFISVRQYTMALLVFSRSPIFSVCHNLMASLHIRDRRLFRFAIVSRHLSASHIAVYFGLSRYPDTFPCPKSLFILFANVSWHHLHTRSLFMFVNQRQPLNYVYADFMSVQQWLETSMLVYARSG
jgi:hypothetical protein